MYILFFLYAPMFLRFSSQSMGEITSFVSFASSSYNIEQFYEIKIPLEYS